jgi:hypothetical protein
MGSLALASRRLRRRSCCKIGPSAHSRWAFGPTAKISLRPIRDGPSDGPSAHSPSILPTLCRPGLSKLSSCIRNISSITHLQQEKAVLRTAGCRVNPRRGLEKGRFRETPKMAMRCFAPAKHRIGLRPTRSASAFRDPIRRFAPVRNRNGPGVRGAWKRFSAGYLRLH